MGNSCRAITGSRRRFPNINFHFSFLGGFAFSKSAYRPAIRRNAPFQNPNDSYQKPTQIMNHPPTCPPHPPKSNTNPATTTHQSRFRWGGVLFFFVAMCEVLGVVCGKHVHSDHQEAPEPRGRRKNNRRHADWLFFCFLYGALRFPSQTKTRQSNSQIRRAVFQKPNHSLQNASTAPLLVPPTPKPKTNPATTTA